jgi:hypothetical protein
MPDDKVENIYKSDQISLNNIKSKIKIDKVSDREKLIAAKQILLGIAIIYIITMFACLFNPKEGEKLVDVCTVTLPPIATLIIAFYFREKEK